eukprot:SAG25_NODE_5447_length_656_cov_1.804309_1_plen_58_part_00
MYSDYYVAPKCVEFTTRYIQDLSEGEGCESLPRPNPPPPRVVWVRVKIMGLIIIRTD